MSALSGPDHWEYESAALVISSSDTPHFLTHFPSKGPPGLQDPAVLRLNGSFKGTSPSRLVASGASREVESMHEWRSASENKGWKACGTRGLGRLLHEHPFPNRNKCVIRYSPKNPVESPRVPATSRWECPAPDAVCG
jgi:hypothetical protein